MDKQTLKRIMPYASDANIDKYISHLNDTMKQFSIDTPLRQAHFLAQSGEAYEGRKDLGNTSPGDGVKYKGRGLIQLTGKANYKAFDDYTHGVYNLLEHPERVEQPDLATMVAGWFWDKNNLNRYADQDDARKVTKIINGGYNGLDDRLNFLKQAKAALNC